MSENNRSVEQHNPERDYSIYKKCVIKEAQQAKGKMIERGGKESVAEKRQILWLLLSQGNSHFSIIQHMILAPKTRL